MERTDLPEELLRAPFGVARAWELGLRPSDLRRRGLHHPTHGVRVAAEPDGLLERARCFAEALPDDSAFSHVTAAQLHGIPLPPPHGQALTLDVMGRSDSAPTRRKGCRGHKGLESREVVLRSGLRVVSTIDTWCDLGEVGPPPLGMPDLVVAGDAVVARLTADHPIGLLGEALSRRVRPRRGRILFEALSLVRRGVRSPMESRARLMFVRARFPEPEVNVPVHDAAGEWLLEGDLVWREQRVVGEYQGAEHANRRRRSADAHRSGLAGDEGWTVLEIWAEDVVPGARRRTTLLRFARELGLDPRTLRIT